MRVPFSSTWSVEPRARHLHEVPLADRPQVAALRRDHAVGGAVELPRVELRVLARGVVEDLDLAHRLRATAGPYRDSGSRGRCCRPAAACIPAAPVIAVLRLREDVAALPLLADDGAVRDLVVLERPVQPVKSLPLKTARSPSRRACGAISFASLDGDLADEDVPPADLAAVRLQQDLPQSSAAATLLSQ